MPVIRAARGRDVAEISRLLAQLGYPTEIPAVAARLTAIAASPRHAVFVAEADTAPGAPPALAGLVALEQRLQLESGEYPEIVALVVDAQARRGGAGRALVAAAWNWARSQGGPCLRVRSNVVREEAHPFYEGLGFVRGKTQHVYELPLPPSRE